MKTAILFASSNGTVADCAAQIAQGLRGDTVLVDLKRQKVPALEGFDTVVVGGSVHAGSLQGKVKKLMRSRGGELADKRLGLFLCSMEKSAEQFESVFPESLHSAAVARGIFGGRMNPETMNWLIRAVVKKVSGSLEAKDTVDTEAIGTFIETLNA